MHAAILSDCFGTLSGAPQQYNAVQQIIVDSLIFVYRMWIVAPQ
jgi:hypothetical protein